MVEASTISFQCPSCSSRITVPGKFAGKSGACSKCGEKVIAPKTQPAGHDSTPGSAIVDEVSGLHGSSADLLGPLSRNIRTITFRQQKVLRVQLLGLSRDFGRSYNTAARLSCTSREVQDQFYHNSLSVSGLRGRTHCLRVKSQTNPLR